MRFYPQMTMHHILYQLPLAQGFALIAGGIAVDPQIEATPEDGYVRQGVRMIAARKNKEAGL